MIIIKDNFLDEDYLQSLINVVEKGKKIKLDSSGTHVMKEKTEYDWYMINSEIRTSSIRYKLLEKIDKLTGEKTPDELTYIHLFAKEFDKNSFCAPHIEDPKLYGNWTFMLYCTDEKDGALSGEGFSILPKYNRIVIMKTGTIMHKVDKCSGRRLNIAGWPYATDLVVKKWKENK
tara:strand:+ start:71 stop:595 length:525 start_codon:yes stop_codon:yes gene_type:complete